MTPAAAGSTIFALSSGNPPAAIAVVRMSGPNADAALGRLIDRLPPPRRASLRTLHAGDGTVLDRALVLRFPGRDTATGEDLVELHLHGGRATVSAVLATLAALPGLRMAEPGEFTRRALANGRIDLTEAEGLADLLQAETETQRVAALRLAEGGLSKRVETWRGSVLMLAARIEALLDFADEGDVDEAATALLFTDIDALACEVAETLAVPPAERLRDGVRVAIAGPPNAGKSTLLNALIGRDAAIVSPIAGTTRDVIEAPVVIDDVAFLFQDTAGLRDTVDPIEGLGVARAGSITAAADIVLWLGEGAPPTAGSTIVVGAKADLEARTAADVILSAHTGMGMADLRALLLTRARTILPQPDAIALNLRQRSLVSEAHAALGMATRTDDLLVAAEELRSARVAFDRLSGRAGVEDMLDALFGRFCIGK